VEAEDTLQKLLRTSKKLGIDPVAVLDECGTFGDGDDYEEKHVVTMKETDRTQLVDFLETQIEIHEDLHDVSDSVFTETMMNILRDLKNVFGSEEVDG
jgi:N-dimethylarginine dimethylaminohydrolase